MIFENLDLNTIWFILVGVLFAGYAMLDGFDLGVGALHLLTRDDRERRIMLNSIGPVWDGNEVWLVTGGGALFAAFPIVYATVFSGMYTAFMLLLAALIFRAVAIEFRSKQSMGWWRRGWDYGFAGGSIVSSLLIGIAMGNIAWGLPLNGEREYAGGLAGLLHPYALLLGVTTLALFMMHGSIYVVLKTEGELQRKARGWIRGCMVFFIVCYVILTMATLLYVPHLTEKLRGNPWFFGVALVGMLAIANIPREVHRGREFAAFLSSCGAIVALMILFGLEMYPHLVISRPEMGNSLDIHNAASSRRTLANMLTIAVIGIPIVLAYTFSIYWIFRGKVKLDKMSY